MPQIVTLCLGVVSTTIAAALSEQCTHKSLTYMKVIAMGCVFFLPLHFIWAFILQPIYLSPLLAIPSAPRVPGLAGFLKQINSDEVLEMMDNIPNEGALRHLDILNREVIVLTEPRMVADFFGAKSYNFVKQSVVRQIVERILGKGLVTSEGAAHKHQRKHLLAPFNASVVRALYPLFWGKASELASLIRDDIVKNSGSSNRSKVDVENWAGRVSLDIIGQAGFGYDFSSLQNPNTPLNTAYRTAFLPNPSSAWVFGAMLVISPKILSYFPIKRVTEVTVGANAVTNFVRALIEERKRQMFMNVDDLEYIEKTGQGDIISVAMKSGGFDTDGLVDQSKTLLGAGHETSSGALAFALHLLSQPKHAHIQEKLRQEICANLPSPSSGIPIEASMIDRLPYLDAVNKEVLRICPPVPAIGRVAAVDTDICGLRIPKGTYVRVHPWAINKSKHLWGDDAREFKPERWLTGKYAATGGAQDMLANMTFGHGPRGCIGRGFAVAENKALISVLIGSFDFKAVPGSDKNPYIIFSITSRIAGGPQVTASIVDGW